MRQASTRRRQVCRKRFEVLDRTRHVNPAQDDTFATAVIHEQREQLRQASLFTRQPERAARHRSHAKETSRQVELALACGDTARARELLKDLSFLNQCLNLDSVNDYIRERKREIRRLERAASQ